MTTVAVEQVTEQLSEDVKPMIDDVSKAEEIATESPTEAETVKNVGIIYPLSEDPTKTSGTTTEMGPVTEETNVGITTENIDEMETDMEREVITEKDLMDEETSTTPIVKVTESMDGSVTETST